jgi:hypothetical protein
MDNQPIVSPAHIRKMARGHFERGGRRDAHGMNPWAPALVVWHGRFDRMAKVARARLMRQAAADRENYLWSLVAGKASPASHTAPAGRQHVDQAQGVV